MMPADRGRTRLFTAAGLAAAAVTVASAPAASFALAGSAPVPSASSAGTAPASASLRSGPAAKWLPAPAARAPRPGQAAYSGLAPSPASSGQAAASAQRDGAAGRYRAYVALTGASSVAEVNAANHKIIASVPADSVRSVAVTPDGATLYVAETGQSDVLVATIRPGAAGPGRIRRIDAGPFPQSVAVSPDGREVYACVSGVSGGGAGGVAVIGTAADGVRQVIPVDGAPREVVFSPDGSRAYATTARAVQEINTATGRVAGTVPDPAGPQGIAVSPDGRRLYVANPGTDDVWEIATRNGAVTARIPAGSQPWALAAGPAPGWAQHGGAGGGPHGGAVYVADMNSDSVTLISTATGRVIRRTGVGRLPASAAVTPDGAQVWVGNDMSGTISVISTATGTVTATIADGSGTAPVDAGPLGIAFGPVP